MKQTVLLFAVALIATATIAQPVLKQQKEYGGTKADNFAQLCITKDSGLTLGGTSYSGISGNKTTVNKGGADFWIIKQDKAGTKKWQKTIGGSGDDVLNDIKATADGGYILAGYSNSPISGNKTDTCRGNWDYWVVKTDSLGRIEWDKTLGGNNEDRAYSIEQTTDSGYIVAGSSFSPASGDKSENTVGGSDVFIDSDIWLVKLNKNGAIQWQNTIGGIADEGIIHNGSNIHARQNRRLMDCKQAPDGGYLVGTTSTSNISGDKTDICRGSGGGTSGYPDYWVVKTDNLGNVVWDKTVGGNDEDYLSALEVTSDGGSIVGGYSYSRISGEKTADKKVCDYWVVKLNSTGAKQWDKTIGSGSVDILQAIQQTSDGGYLLAGNSTSGKSGDKSEGDYGGQDYWIVKINSTGAKQWDKTIGGSGNEYGYDIKEVAPNAYYLGGLSYSDTSGNKKVPVYGSTDYWILKIIYHTPPSAGDIITSSKLSRDIEMANTKNLSIYPNPASTVLHIQSNAKTTFVLSDQSGKRILSRTVQGSGDLNIAGVPAGTYYLTNTTTGASQKVVIIK